VPQKNGAERADQRDADSPSRRTDQLHQLQQWTAGRLTRAAATSSESILDDDSAVEFCGLAMRTHACDGPEEWPEWTVVDDLGYARFLDDVCEPDDERIGI
jgi:hypothetical protein